MQFIETLSTSDPTTQDAAEFFAVQSSWTVRQLISLSPTGDAGELYWLTIDEMRGNDVAPSITDAEERGDKFADLDSSERYALIAQMRADPENAVHAMNARVVDDGGEKAVVVDPFNLTVENVAFVELGDEEAAAQQEQGYSHDAYRQPSLQRHNRDVDWTEELARLRPLDAEDHRASRLRKLWNERAAIEARQILQGCSALVALDMREHRGRWSEAIFDAFILGHEQGLADYELAEMVDGNDAAFIYVQLSGPHAGLAATRSIESFGSRCSPFTPDEVLADWWAEHSAVFVPDHTKGWRRREADHVQLHEWRMELLHQQALRLRRKMRRTPRTPAGHGTWTAYRAWHDAVQRFADWRQDCEDSGLTPIWASQRIRVVEDDGSVTWLTVPKQLRYVKPARWVTHSHVRRGATPLERAKAALAGKPDLVRPAVGLPGPRTDMHTFRLPACWKLLGDETLRIWIRVGERPRFREPVVTPGPAPRSRAKKREKVGGDEPTTVSPLRGARYSVGEKPPLPTPPPVVTLHALWPPCPVAGPRDHRAERLARAQERAAADA